MAFQAIGIFRVWNFSWFAAFIEDGKVSGVNEYAVPAISGQLVGDAGLNEAAHGFGGGGERYAGVHAELL